MEPDSLSGLAAFVRVAEVRSFTAAAVTFGVSPSAMSHTIKQLEAKLDVRLFNRTTRSVSLTQAGTDLLRRIGPLMSELRGAVQQVTETASKPAGILRLNLPRTASIVLIEPVLREFLDAYPDVELDVVIDNGLIDIVREGFDAGIRFGEALDNDMVTVPVRPDLRVAVVAAPGYLARHGRPTHPAELHAHQCINFRGVSTGTVYQWRFEKQGETIELAVTGRLTTNDSILALQAALDGVGVAYLFDDYVERFLRSGALVRVLEDWSPVDGLFLYYFNRRGMPPKLRAFIEFLKERNQRTGIPDNRLVAMRGAGAALSH